MLAGNGGGAEFKAEALARGDMGVICDQKHATRPIFPLFAFDNGMFAHRYDPGWWEREGERSWFRMIDRAAAYRPAPLFVLLPDVVYDWRRTLDRAYRYVTEVRIRGLNEAVALQDGATQAEVEAFSPRAVFVGGSRRWKWEQVPLIRAWWPRWMHVGRANGWRQIAYCAEIGVDSIDGTSFNRFWSGRRGGRAMIEKAERATSQLRLI